MQSLCLGGHSITRTPLSTAATLGGHCISDQDTSLLQPLVWVTTEMYMRKSNQLSSLWCSQLAVCTVDWCHRMGHGIAGTLVRQHGIVGTLVRQHGLAGMETGREGGP